MNRREFMKSVSAVGLIALFPFKAIASVFTPEPNSDQSVIGHCGCGYCENIRATGPGSAEVEFTREKEIAFDFTAKNEKSLVVEGKVFVSGKWTPFKEILKIESSASESEKDFLKRVLIPESVLIPRLLKKYPGPFEVCEIFVRRVE